MYLRAITVAMTLFSCVLDGSFEPRNAKQSVAPQQKHVKSPENPALDFGRNGARMLGHTLNLKRAQTCTLERCWDYYKDPLEDIDIHTCPKA